MHKRMDVVALEKKITLEEKIVTYMGRHINLWKDVKLLKDSNRVAIDILEWNITDKAKPTNDELDSIKIFINPSLERAERLRRDRLIAETDWTQVEDSPLSLADKEKYKEYRKMLRDISKQEGFPSNIIWPKIEVK